MNKFSLFSLSLLTIFASLSFTNNKSSQDNIVKAEGDITSQKTYNVTEADVSLFGVKLKTVSKTLTIDEENKTITNSKRAGFHACYVSTSQFDTTASSYYLKTHVENLNYKMYGDDWLGFNIYYDNINFFNFSLKWGSQTTGTISEAVFYAKINGEEFRHFNYAKLPNGVFQLSYNASYPSSPFTDVWCDFGGWFTGDNRDSGTGINMFHNYKGGVSDTDNSSGSTILPNKGFDMTLYVDRTTYKDRLVDVMQIQVDGFGNDEVTPMTFFTPKFAIDAFTAPKGVESEFAYIKPSIGFWNYNVGNVTYSNIEFGSNKVNEPSTATFAAVGEAPELASIDNDTGIIKYNNNNFNSGFIMANNLELTTPRADFQAHVKGNIGDVNGASIGYTFYYDEKNYIIVYLEWNGSAGTIDGFHILATVDGNSKNVYQGASNPWDNPSIISGASGYQSIDEIKSLFSDSSGFITDNEYPCGIDANFNNIRSESKITLSTGFDMGVIRRRTIFMSRTIDCYQMYIIATGTDSKVHTWYTPLWNMDAFTYSNGGEESSSLINETPLIGFYVYKADEVTITDIKYNGSDIKAKDISQLEFGTRTEGEFIVSGSDHASNWVSYENTLTESWEELAVDSYKYEVNALVSNDEANLYTSAYLSMSRTFSKNSYVGIYSYFLDENNYLLTSIAKTNNEIRLICSGKLNGEYLGGLDSFINARLSIDIKSNTLIEVETSDNTINVYLENSAKPNYSYTFKKQDFKSRNLSNSSIGYTFYNASGTISNYVLKSKERINPYIPSEEDKPVIYQYGNREVSGFINYSFSIPNFVAYNYLHELIDVKVTVSDAEGNVITTLENGETSFTVNKIGTYTIAINATDEWGHEADTLSYKVNFIKYYGPGESAPKQVLWQTVVVLSIFGAIVIITIWCAIVLIKKNKKEALKSEELNRKNREKNLLDEEGY